MAGDRRTTTSTRPHLAVVPAPAFAISVDHAIHHLRFIVATGALGPDDVVPLRDALAEGIAQSAFTVLDLQGLAACDPRGIAEIADAAVAATRRGRDVVIIPGSGAVHSALIAADPDHLLRYTS